MSIHDTPPPSHRLNIILWFELCPLYDPIRFFNWGMKCVFQSQLVLYKLEKKIILSFKGLGLSLFSLRLEECAMSNIISLRCWITYRKIRSYSNGAHSYFWYFLTLSPLLHDSARFSIPPLKCTRFWKFWFFKSFYISASKGLK